MSRTAPRRRQTTCTTRAAGLLGMVLALLLPATPARSEDIATVLWRSHAERLATLPEGASQAQAAAALRRDVERLSGAVIGRSPRLPVELRVVASGTLAETIQGRVIVVNAALADWPRDARWFVLGHELCHVQEAHWAERVRLYQRFIPGTVNRAQTDGVAAELGAAASRQSHGHEHAADECAMNLLLDMDYTEDHLLSMLMRMGAHRATATHPSLGQRISHLRAIAERRRLAATPVAPKNEG